MLILLQAALLLVLLGPAASGSAGVGLSAPLVLASGAGGGRAAWADYDNDGDLDLLVTGTGSYGQRATLLYRQQGGQLAEVLSGLPRLEYSSFDWGDYDNDGWLDVVIAGKMGFFGGQIAGYAGVYRNAPNPDPAGPSPRVFMLVQRLPNLYSGAVRWGDYDRDGRLDLLLTGYGDGGAPLTRIYRGRPTAFTGASEPFAEASFALPGLGGGTAEWGDYDGDGRLDFVIQGRDAGGAPRALLYRAAPTGAPGGGFTLAQSLEGVWGGSALFFDLERDGDLDLLLTGNRGDNAYNIQPVTRLYRNQGGALQPISGHGLPHLWESALTAGDYNGDGFSDLLVNGLTLTARPAAIYLNNGNGTFQNAQAGLPDGARLGLAWGDFSGDGALDLAVSGVIVGDIVTTRIYRADSPAPPVFKPGAPAPLSACWDGADGLQLSWAAPDGKAPVGVAPGGAGLTYALRAGTLPGGIDIESPEADAGSGYRRLPQPGRLSVQTSALLRGLQPGQEYHWAVQAISPALVGSPFSVERTVPFGAALAVDDTLVTVENTPLAFDPLQNDAASFGPLSVRWIGAPTAGMLTGVKEGYRYTPPAGWHGQVTIDYQAMAASGYCTPGRVTITVLPVNDPPTAILLSGQSVLTGLPPGALVGRLSAADPDVDDSHTFMLDPDWPDNALFQVSGDRLETAVTLEPGPGGASAARTVWVTARDAAGASISQSFIIQVVPSTPVSIACASGCEGYDLAARSVRVTMSEDGAPLAFLLVLRGLDASPDEPLAWSVVEPPHSGTAALPSTSLPGQPVSVQYAPAADWFSASPGDRFVLRVDDSQGNHDTLTVQVLVLPVNDPPALEPIPNQVFPAVGGAQQVALNGIRPGPSNEAGQPLDITASTDRPDLLPGLRVDYPGAGERAVLHLEAAGAAGMATVWVTLSDGQPEHGSLTRAFTVALLGGPPALLPLVIQP